MIVLWLLACDPPSSPVDTAVCDAVPGQGVDPVVIDGCSACHSEQVAAYTGSHALLLDCRGCHALSAPSGGGHADRPACSGCHSEASHAGLDCATCHDPHGTSNLALLRTSIAGSTVQVTAALGLAPDGLAHGDGTGLCEVCHVGSAHYDAAGEAPPHESRWCGACHSHATGFQPR